MVSRAVVWLCRTPQRLAAAVVVLLAVVLLGGGAIFGGPLGGERTPSKPKAEPVPTAAQVPDASPYVAAAVTFVRSWSQLQPGETAQQWQAKLAPLATTQFADELKTTDPATLPGVQAEGEPVIRFLAQSSALVAVPLADGSSVLVSVVTDGTAEKVSNVQPDAGD
jgi:hypothetical protein